MNVEKVYNGIAQNMIDVIEGEWSEAVLQIEANANNCRTTGKYRIGKETKGELDVHQFDDFLDFEIMELNDFMAQQNHRWNRAVFTVYPDHQFEMAFIWDQALHDEGLELGQKD